MEKFVKFVIIGLIGTVCFTAVIYTTYYMISLTPPNNGNINERNDNNEAQPKNDDEISDDTNNEDGPSNEDEENNSTDSENESLNLIVNLSLIVNYNNGSIKRILNFTMIENSTAFEATDKYCHVECDSRYEWGAFITSIDYLEQNEAEGKYWLYYINGDFASVSAGAYKLRDNDRIEWRYGEQYNP
ncbi:MAG: DUF4430 domain-containing protein [Promethearchaeota archaeon]